MRKTAVEVEVRTHRVPARKDHLDLRILRIEDEGG